MAKRIVSPTPTRKRKATHKVVGTGDAQRIVIVPTVPYLHLLVVKHGREAPTVGYQLRIRQPWYAYNEWFGEEACGDIHRALQLGTRAAIKHARLAEKARRQAWRDGDVRAAPRVIRDIARPRAGDARQLPLL